MPDEDVSFSVVLTTLTSVEDARSLVNRLVSDRIVACGTIVDGAISIYEWRGTLEESREVLVVMKTRRENWDALQSAVRELHPYEVPELLELPVEEGMPPYLEWLAEQTKQE